MQDKQSASRGGVAALKRFWRSRRSFKGFGLLLFYCHMLMLFSFLVRTLLPGYPEYALLISAGKLLVPTLFALTSVSLFIPPFFWPGLILGFLHLPFATFFVLRGPVPAWPWLLGLLGLLLLLLLTLFVKLRYQVPALSQEF